MRALLTFAYLLLFSTLCSAEGIKLKVVTEDLPPFQIDNGTKAPTGVMVELVNLILKEAELDAAIELFPWSRSYSLAKTKPNTLIFSMLRSEERETKFTWVAKLFSINSYLVALKTRNDIEIGSIEQAKNYSVGSVRDDLAEEFLLQKGFKHDHNLYVTSKYPALWQMLFNGRTDVAFTNEFVWQHEVKATGLDTSKIKIIYQIPDFGSELYLAASLNTDATIISKLKQAFERVKQNGSYQATIEKWLAIKSP